MTFIYIISNAMHPHPSRVRFVALPLAFALALPLASACSSSSSTSSSSGSSGSSSSSGSLAGDPDAKTAATRFALVAHASYGETLTRARAMKTAIDAFLAAPSAATLDAAKRAWIAARDPYGQTESFRFFEGPIDDESGPEGRVNAWPLDEAFIDYVVGDEGAGMVNHATEFPTFTKELLSEQNEKGGEANVATGWHAIEFLLWGQDLSETGAGARPFTDYVPGATGAQKNAERRRKYLEVVTDLLISDLEGVTAAWDASKPDSYGARFVAAPPEESIAKAWKGIAMLSGIELSRERMNNAYEKGEQEEEHSCFSDNTHADLVGNALAIENVYLGRTPSGDDGFGLDELVKKRDPDLDARVKARLTATVAATKAIPAPFDQAILREPGRSKIKTAIDESKELTTLLIEAAKVCGITVSLTE